MKQQISPALECKKTGAKVHQPWLCVVCTLQYTFSLIFFLTRHENHRRLTRTNLDRFCHIMENGSISDIGKCRKEKLQPVNNFSRVLKEFVALWAYIILNLSHFKPFMFDKSTQLNSLIRPNLRTTLISQF